jgi:archaellum biogenesis protein FlaJ (TadC family)
MNHRLPFLIVFFLLISNMFCSILVHGENPLIIISPQDRETIRETTPTIQVNYPPVDQAAITIAMTIDRYLEIPQEELKITSTNVSYTIPKFLALKNGNHTITVTVSSINGQPATITWTFTVDTSLPGPVVLKFDPLSLILYILLGAIIFFIVFFLYILYLKKNKKFTFKKFFIRHPIKREVIILYIPFIIGFFVILFGLAIVSRTPNITTFSYEYVFVIGILIALFPYALQSQFDRRKNAKYERAFSQFLFEMADAMRGGLDPTKAVIELSTSHEGVLKSHLKKAADNIKLGRPFDEVMQSMAKPIKSDLIKRYASLIGETSKVGGETSQVIHRAAKDMDDFIKINQERRRELTAQTTTIYMAFGVLLIILYQLITMFPSLGSMNIGLLGQTSLEDIKNTSVARMSTELMKRRFFHLMIINSLGTGTIIGAFIDGKIRYGLIHSIILTITSVLFFIILIF